MGYQLEIRHIKYFLAVAEDLHFRKAAEKLNISQPALSKQIKELEDHTGIQLFKRNNRTVLLTDAGIYLKQELTGYFSGLSQVFNHAKLIEKGLIGELRIGYIGSAMENFIPEFLEYFKAKHSEVIFNLEELENQNQLDSLVNNKIDIGFVRQENLPESIESFKISEESFSLAVSDDHFIDINSFESLRQFREDSFILFSQENNPDYYKKIMDIFDYNNFQPKTFHNTINHQTVLNLVSKGYGVAIIPNSLTLTEVEGIRFIDLSYLPQKTSLSLIWNKDNRNPIIKKFTHLIKEIVQEKDALVLS